MLIDARSWSLHRRGCLTCLPIGYTWNNSCPHRPASVTGIKKEKWRLSDEVQYLVWISWPLEGENIRHASRCFVEQIFHTEVRNEWNIKVSAWVWSCRRGRSDDTFSTRSFLPSSESLHFSFLIPVTEAGWWGQELFHVSPIGRHVRQPHRCKLQLLASINMKARFILNPNVSYFLTSPILETVQPVDGQVFFTKYFPFQRFLTW